MCGTIGQFRQTKARRQALRFKYRSCEVAWGEVLEVEVEFEVEEEKKTRVVEKKVRQGEYYNKRGEE